MTAKRKPTHVRECRESYRITDYGASTTDAKHCPRCGSTYVVLLGHFSSGKRIGVCRECGENYVVERSPDARL